MQSESNGPLATFLLFVPLVAVPLLAVFGIPQFAPVAASPGGDAAPELGTAVIEDSSAPEASADRFAPFPPGEDKPIDSHGGNSAGQRGDPWGDPFHPSRRSTQAKSGNSAAATTDSPWVPPAEALDQWKPDSLQPRTTTPRGTQPAVRANFDQPRQLQPDAMASVDDRLNVRHDWIADPRRRADGQEARPIERHPDAFLPITDSRRQIERNDPGPSPFENNPFEQRAAATADRRFNPQSEIQNPQADLSGFGGPPTRFVKEESSRGGVSPDGSRNLQSAVDNPRSTEPLTWPAAVQRLKELDIRHFQLEPGERDVFLFSCFFTPNDNPRLTHRFEAEATDPLRAVEKVLAQVEQWLQKR